MDRRTFLAALGVAGMGSGAIVTTGALTRVSGNRELSVGTVDDPNAVLGLGGVSDAGVTPSFSNNANRTMWVQLDSPDSSATFDVGDDNSPGEKPIDFTLSPEDTVEVGVSGDSQSVPVDVYAELRDAGGAVVGSVSLTRDYTVPQSGQVVLEPNVKSAGNSGKYEFQLTNSGSIDVVIEAIGVNGTGNPNVVEVSKGDIFVAGKTQHISSTIPVDSATADDTRVDFDMNGTVDLPANSGQSSSTDFEFDRFQNDQGKNADMQGASVTATFYFTDGSSKEIEMTP